jgi:hypothetical protein
MIRMRGDRVSLLAALLAHWSEEQLALPAEPHPWLLRANSRGAAAGQGRRPVARRSGTA